MCPRRLHAILAVSTTAAILAAGGAYGQGKDLDGVVNLNTAAPEVLELLPGIGPAKVRSIVSYRQRRPFRTVDELVRIKGIGRKMVRRLRVHLAVNGPTTAHAIRRSSPADPTPMPASPLPPAKLKEMKPKEMKPKEMKPKEMAKPSARPTTAVAGAAIGRPSIIAPARARARAPPIDPLGRRSAADHCARPP